MMEAIRMMGAMRVMGVIEIVDSSSHQTANQASHKKSPKPESLRLKKHPILQQIIQHT